MAWSLSIHEQSCFLEVAEVALVEPHLTKHLVCRGHPAIGNTPRVQGFVADVDSEVAETCPLSVFLRTDGKCQFTTFILFEQLVPFIDVKISVCTIGVHITTLRTLYLDIDGRIILICHAEVQGSQSYRDGHTRIVRIDLWQRLHPVHVLWARTAGTQSQHHQQCPSYRLELFFHLHVLNRISDPPRIGNSHAAVHRWDVCPAAQDVQDTVCFLVPNGDSRESLPEWRDTCWPPRLHL